MATGLSSVVFVLVAATVVRASVLPTERRCQLLCEEAGGSSPEVQSDSVCVCHVTQDVIDLDYQNLETVKKKARDMGMLFIHVPQAGRYERCLDRILRLKAKNAENEEEFMRKKWQRYQTKKHRGLQKILEEKDDDIKEKIYTFKGRRRGKGYEGEEQEYERERKGHMREEKGYERDEKDYEKDEREYEREAVREEHKDSERSRRAEFNPVTKHPLIVPRVVPRL
ncbi:uncharacterized protein LOC126215282 [Schistocerca nitens]|uniref:uncharacterized protein LOC126215282 n=1 Tax=Schistocerca nitens TaxID=7011 RepID=UPI0021174DD4|nr:uncharacterized protein LOC126215282 [Schistocerca nitens]